jgi:hypothetical protein
MSLPNLKDKYVRCGIAKYKLTKIYSRCFPGYNHIWGGKDILN